MFQVVVKQNCSRHCKVIKELMNSPVAICGGCAGLGQYGRFFNPVTGLNTLRCFLRDFVAAIVVIFRVATLKAYMQGN